MFAALNEYGVVGRAGEQGRFELKIHDPRDYSDNKYRRVDDRPYGGGPGMVMMAPPLAGAIQAARQGNSQAKVIYLTPQGRRLDHTGVMELVTRPGMILLAGRYEGVDERLLETEVDEEWSIGDYVLSGGELAAMVLIDAVVRQLPGTLGDAESAEQDSFAQAILDTAHYTRPEIYAGYTVPETLLSGDHARIQRWRRQQALGRTWLRRPDLLEKAPLSAEDHELLLAFQRQHGKTGESV